MAGLVRCVSKLVHVCVCPLGLLRPPLPQHHLGPQLQHLPRLDLLGLMQGGYDNDTLHHTLHQTVVRPRHTKATGATKSLHKRSQRL